MGREARCMVHWRDINERRAIYLESTQLEVRGKPPLKVPLKDIKAVTADDTALTLKLANGTLTLELGKEAAAWAKAITSPKSRIDKLGIKPGQAVCLVNVDDKTLASELETKGAVTTTRLKTHDVIFFYAEQPRDLERLAKLREHLVSNGTLWLLRRKGKDAVIAENASRSAAKDAGLVDVKVVSFDDALSAEKYVIPKAARR